MCWSSESRKHSCGHVQRPLQDGGFTCRRSALCWGRRRIPTAAHVCTPPSGGASSAAASRGPAGDETKAESETNWEKDGKERSVSVCARTHPCLEKLVVDLEEAGQLHADLLHGDRDEAHVPVQTTHFLLQELDQKLCNQATLSWWFFWGAKNTKQKHLIFLISRRLQLTKFLSSCANLGGQLGPKTSARQMGRV